MMIAQPTFQSIQHDPENTILVIDDNPTNLRIAVNSLEQQGFNVLIARDGASGIKRAKYAHPYLILLDVLMPGINGFETCLQLKSTPETQNIPVIFMTALANPEDKIKGFEVGAVDYITKPIQVDELIARVNLHLNLYLFNQQLEQRVEERTVELSQALEELQQSQFQLVQSEKMSALGQLMAGINHEINNPAGFVSGNLTHVKEYLQDITEHLQLYQKYFPNPGEEIKQNAEEIELDYLLKDLPEILSSMQIGMNRIREISSSMRIFSRADTDKKVSFDLHEGINSTLLILKHRLKAKNSRPEIKVIKQYGDLPQIIGFPGQLNQVFMNIIANAIDVFDEMSESMASTDMNQYNYQINIKTHSNVDRKQVVIKIEDNGQGIPENVKSKIFDNLFTTKPVGKGTGLGLSLSRQIIEEKHGGKIQCESHFGIGTQFIIVLPIS
ncbi:MAG: response regulator [Microcoleaceae cyanobacterium]